ncbi:MAG: icmT [Gammaproteobacteria bacterium]|nr:icmT [Gammaproteobacteria bacterium]
MIHPPSPDASWRDSARYPKLFFVDARAVFPVIFCLLHLRLWTIAIALSVTIFFAILDYYGFTIAVFSRWFRSMLAGKRKAAIPWWM